MLHTTLFSLITTLLAANNRQDELLGKSYELIHFNFDLFTSDHQLEFDYSGTHYKVQLIADDHTVLSDNIDDSSPSKSCHYFGSILEPKHLSDSSYLSLSLCSNRGIRGSIITGTGDSLWIMPSAYYFDTEYGKRMPKLVDEHLIYTSVDHGEDGIDGVLPMSRSSRKLLASHWNNQVELFVMSDPALTQRFKDTYSSNWYRELKNFIQDLINSASAKYKAKNWGNAGNVELRFVYLEIAESFSGIYASLYPTWSYGDMIIPGTDRKNCKDWKNYKSVQDGGCVIAGSCGGCPQAYIDKFRAWTKGRTENKKYDDHLLLSGLKFAGIAGVAYRGGLCTNQNHAALGGIKQRSLEHETKTVCHEIGHTFGMQHDMSCEQCIMGRWISWYDWGFEQQAYTQLNEHIDKMTCIRNGVRSYSDNYGSSSYPAPAPVRSPVRSPVYTGSSNDISKCVRVSNVRSGFDGTWKAQGTVNGRPAYKLQGGSKWLYTARDSDGTGGKSWTMGYDKYDGLNSRYYCLKTFIQSCSGNWYVRGTKKTSSRFVACAAYTGEDTPSCVTDNEYDDRLCLTNEGSLWEDEVNKRFDVKTDECMTDKPIYEHIVDDNTSYHVYYDEYLQYVDDNTTSTRWIMSLNDLSANVAAQCDEDNLMDCVEGKWQVMTGFNDSLELVVDPTMGLATCASAAASNASDSSMMVLSIIAAVLCVIILVACVVFVYRTRKAKGKKVVEFTHKSTIADESEDDGVLQEEEVEVEMEVEQTKLTENNGE
eukprot:123718_1